MRASMTRYRIAQDTGITEGQLSRFVHGKGKLSQDSIDTLAGYLGLEIAERQSRKRKGG
jgi:transcriptional regulator with XRE-family HTH domain